MLLHCILVGKLQQVPRRRRRRRRQTTNRTRFSIKNYHYFRWTKYVSAVPRGRGRGVAYLIVTRPSLPVTIIRPETTDLCAVRHCCRLPTRLSPCARAAVIKVKSLTWQFAAIFLRRRLRSRSVPFGHCPFSIRRPPRHTHAIIVLYY